MISKMSLSETLMWHARLDRPAGSRACCLHEMLRSLKLKLSIVDWILLVIALLRAMARVDVKSSGHKLISSGPMTWFPPIVRS
jgi:hypothetical protein